MAQPEGETLRTFTIPTTTASAALHDRMAVILEPDAWPLWLVEVAGNHIALVRPAPAGTVRLWPVSRAVNSVRKNAHRPTDGKGRATRPGDGVGLLAEGHGPHSADCVARHNRALRLGTYGFDEI